MDLEHCLAPIDREEFREKYWERQPLEIHRADRKHYGDIFSLADIDAYLQIARMDPQPTSILIANQSTRLRKTSSLVLREWLKLRLL